jgi:hypothetical protein
MKNKIDAVPFTPSPASRGGRWCAVLLCATTLLIFTLKPFQFINPPKSWDFDVFPRDMFQNVILFLPFGILLRRSLSLSLPALISVSFLFSLGIECLQLYTPHRFSNPYDIACNSAGGAIGAWGADLIFSRRHLERNAELATLLLLLCWVLGLGIKGEPLSLFAFFPFAVAGAVLVFHSTTTQSVKRLLVMTIWCSLLVAFLFYYLRMYATLFLPPVWAAGILFSVWPKCPRRTFVVLLSLGTLLLVFAVALRLVLSPWNWDLSLRVMEVLLLIDILQISGITHFKKSSASILNV